MGKTVLQLCDYGGPYSGNFIASLTRLGRVLEADGQRQIIVLSSDSRKHSWVEDLVRLGTDVAFLGKGQSVLALGLQIAKLVPNGDAVMLHTHFTSYDIPAWLALKGLRTMGTKAHLVWHAHSNFPVRSTPSRRIKDWAKYRVMGRDTHLVAVSDEVLQATVARGMDPIRSSVVDNGVDTDRVRWADSKKVSRTRLGLDQDSVIVLQFGWNPYVKGVDVALDAVAQLQGKGLKIHLLLVGGQPLVDFVRDRLGDRLPPWVKVIPPQEDVSELYGISDVYLLSSRSEGWAYSVGEAMVAGLPVVASDLASLSWTRGAPGVIKYPAGQASRLATVLGEVVGWPARYRGTVTGANAVLVETNYSLDAWAQKIMRVYRAIEEERPSNCVSQDVKGF